MGFIPFARALLCVLEHTYIQGNSWFIWARYLSPKVPSAQVLGRDGFTEQPDPQVQGVLPEQLEGRGWLAHGFSLLNLESKRSVGLDSQVAIAFLSHMLLVFQVKCMGKKTATGDPGAFFVFWGSPKYI